MNIYFSFHKSFLEKNILSLNSKAFYFLDLSKAQIATLSLKLFSKKVIILDFW
jgi:hypothetical protein